MRFLLVWCLLLQGCAAVGAKHPVLLERPDWASHFRAAGVEGTLVLAQEGSNSLHVYNAHRAHTRYLPASTFKILNSLIALETGVARGPQEVFPWDGKPHAFAAWNKDLTLREAFAASSVPVYQDLARKIGQERMARYVGQARYGNGDTGGQIDTFWLEGGLRISAVEQIQFLQRLYEGTLPFSKQAMETVKDIMAQDRGADWVLRSKTGWVTSTSTNAGWWVGWLERGGQVWFFACNIDMDRPHEQLKVRKDIVLAVLGAQGLLPQ